MSRWIAVGVRGMTTTRMSVTAAPREERLTEQVERRGGGALAEAHHEQVLPQDVHVPALERVAGAALVRAIEEQSVIGQRRVELEERPDQQLLRPPHVVAHGAHDAVPADHHPDVARKEEVGQRRQREGAVVECPGKRARLALRALDDAPHHLDGRQFGEFARQCIRRHHVERAGDEELARLIVPQHLGEQVADLVDLREAPQHADELAVLSLGHVEGDDVVVQEGGAVLRRHRLELGARRVHQHRLEGADFGGDVD